MVGELGTIALDLTIQRRFMSSISEKPKVMKDQLSNNKPRLRWACRRGMLELDVLFMPFVEEAYDDLSDKNKAIFERLLEGQDPELFAWFMGHDICEDQELNSMVQLILNRVKV
jgi:antitoxin CptB